MTEDGGFAVPAPFPREKKVQGCHCSKLAGHTAPRYYRQNNHGQEEPRTNLDPTPEWLALLSGVGGFLSGSGTWPAMQPLELELYITS